MLPFLSKSEHAFLHQTHIETTLEKRDDFSVNAGRDCEHVTLEVFCVVTAMPVWRTVLVRGSMTRPSTAVSPLPTPSRGALMTVELWTSADRQPLAVGLYFNSAAIRTAEFVHR